MVELSPFDAATYLETEEDVVIFLDDALETGEPFEIADALAVIARAKGLMEAAEQAGLSKAVLDRVAPPEDAPDWPILLNVMKALGLRLAPVAIKPAA